MLTELQPKTKQLVYELVSQAGLDTSDWAHFRGAHPSTNPKYCYEWAFWDETKSVVALCLWFSQMTEDDGQIAQTLNYRALASASSRRDPSVGIRAKRAGRMDRALFMAFKRKLPVRVIVVDGARRGEAGADFSRVELRMLDPVPWRVASYGSDSGECRIVRGEEGIGVRTFLLTWSNFEETPDEDLMKVSDALKTQSSYTTEWSSGNRRDIRVGERVFLLRQGSDYPGIVGRGSVATAPYPGRHWDPAKRRAGIQASYVEVNWHEMRPKQAGLPREVLLKAGFPITVLNAQSSGVMVPDDAVAKLDELWAAPTVHDPELNSSNASEDVAGKRRLGRIAYNSTGWQRPTGDAAGLESGETYNAKNKFGHRAHRTLIARAMRVTGRAEIEALLSTRNQTRRMHAGTRQDAGQAHGRTQS